MENQDKKIIEGARKQLRGDITALKKFNELVVVYEVATKKFSEFDHATTDGSRIGAAEQKKIESLLAIKTALSSTFRLIGDSRSANISYDDYIGATSQKAIDSLKKSKGDFSKVGRQYFEKAHELMRKGAFATTYDDASKIIDFKNKNLQEEVENLSKDSYALTQISTIEKSKGQDPQQTKSIRSKVLHFFSRKPKDRSDSVESNEPFEIVPDPPGNLKQVEGKPQIFEGPAGLTKVTSIKEELNFNDKHFTPSPTPASPTPASNNR
jgi:hypothetical protein